MESYEKDTMIQNENGKLITSVLQFIITFVWEGRYSMFFLQTCVCKHGIKNNNVWPKQQYCTEMGIVGLLSKENKNKYTTNELSHSLFEVTCYPQKQHFPISKKKEPREKQNITTALRVVAVVVQQELTQWQINPHM